MDVDELKNKARRAPTQHVEDAFCRLFLRNISIRITKYFVRTRITPNQITILSFLIGVLAAVCFAIGEHAYLITGAILIQLSLIFDLVDGEVARIRSLKSREGAWLDPLLDIIGTGLLFLGMAFGLQTRTNYVFAWALPYLAFFGHAIGSFSSSKQLEIYGKHEVSKIKEESNFGVIVKLYLTLYGMGSITLLFLIGAVLNQLVVSLILFTISSNLDWIGKFAWYYGKHKKDKGNIEKHHSTIS